MGSDRPHCSVCHPIRLRDFDEEVATPWCVPFKFVPCAEDSPVSVTLAKTLFFISVMRNAFVIVFLTLASWLYCRDKRDDKGDYPIRILKTVPSGLKHIERPNLDHSLLSALAPKLPVATIILLLEHIAISKCTSSTLWAALRGLTVS